MSYEDELCVNAEYTYVDNILRIRCKSINELCPFQRYCQNRLKCIHSSLALTCKIIIDKE